MKKMILLLIPVLLAPAAAQTGPLRLELVYPDPGEAAHAPVQVLVWRSSEPVSEVVASFRVGGRDLTPLVERRGREWIAQLPAADALGPGIHHLVGDVCVPRGGCASSSHPLQVIAAPDSLALGGTREGFLRQLLRATARWILGSAP